jgi:hypothetical protein
MFKEQLAHFIKRANDDNNNDGSPDKGIINEVI